MAYTDTDTVNAALGVHAATASTTPTLTQLSAIITSVSSFMDGVLKAAGVSSVPVVSGDDSVFYSMLGEINKFGAASEFLKGMFPEATGPGETPAFKYWGDKYDDGIEMLRGDNGIPSPLLGGPNDISPSTYFTRNPNEEETLGDLPQNMDITRIGDRF